MKGGVVKWRRLCVLHFACTYAPPLLVLVRDKRGLKERAFVGCGRDGCNA